MKNQYLTTQNFLKGQLLTFFENMIFASRVSTRYPIEGYKLVQYLNAYKAPNYTVGIYETRDHRKVVLKVLQYKFKNLLYEQILNEANMLKTLSRIELNSTKSLHFRFPSLYELKIYKNIIILVTEYIEGKTFHEYSKNFKLTVIREVVELFEQVSKKIHKNHLINLPRRSPMQIFISFPIILVIVFLKDFGFFSKYLKLGLLFYKNFFGTDIFFTEYALTHRDLHPKNILINKREVVIIDPAISVIAQKETEIAKIAAEYHSELGTDAIISLLKDVLISDLQRRRFISLTIYYTIQSLATENKISIDYKKSKVYARSLISQIIKEICFKRIKVSLNGEHYAK